MNAFNSRRRAASSQSSVFAKKTCHGARLIVTDRNALKPVMTGAAIAVALRRLYPKDFTFDGRLLRDPRSEEAIREGRLPDWSEDERAFIERRAKFLLY